MKRKQPLSAKPVRESKVAKTGKNAFDTHKIIVGVDYGTTYTGVAFVTTAKSDIDDISVITSWPGTSRNSETVYKIPSRIAYPNQNYRMQGIKWGFQVESGMTSYSWTKLLLDKNASLANFDDETLSLQDTAGMPILSLPPGKDGPTVVSDFLKPVYSHLMQTLEKQVSEETLAITPLEFWFTMPAIWSDEAQSATREAAKRAGFGSRPDDMLFMIREPEAAAIAALTKSARDGPLSAPVKGDGVLVCDCGGGTVDITTYLITDTYPHLKFEELCTGTGAKCGSTTIDRAFYKLMIDRFGDNFGSLPLTKRGPGSEFMRAFERIKQDFGSCETDNELYELPLDMSLEGSNPVYFDEDERLVIVTEQDIRSLFDPVVEKIKSLVSQQVNEANRDAGKPVINRIVLVGGFGDSEYLRKALKQEYSAGKVQVIVPQHPQAAIVKGAVLRGLEGVRPTTRRCRRHYGYTFGMPFRNGVDSEEHAYYDMFDGDKLSWGRMHWIVEKGEKLDDRTMREMVLQISSTDALSIPTPTVQLYSCSLDSAPGRVEHPRVTLLCSITTNMSGIDRGLVKSRINHEGVMAYSLSYSVRMHFGATEGVLRFETVVGGKVVGNANVDFSKD